jgi:hypothetical protein
MSNAELNWGLKKLEFGPREVGENIAARSHNNRFAQWRGKVYVKNIIFVITIGNGGRDDQVGLSIPPESSGSIAKAS